MAMLEYLDWLDYATYEEDDNGIINATGVAEDAPPEIKEQWKKFMELKKEAEKRGAKL